MNTLLLLAQGAASMADSLATAQSGTYTCRCSGRDEYA